MAEPAHVDPSTYGWNGRERRFVHPESTPYTHGPRPTEGALDYLDQNEYIDNMTVEGRWPIVIPSGGHTWQHVLDWEGRRYMYHYYRAALNIYDITDPRNLEVVVEKRYGPDEMGFGAARIAYNDNLGESIMIQSFEVPRTTGSMSGKKYDDPAILAAHMQAPGFRGFRTFKLTGPTSWELLAEVSTDVLHPHARVQEGSGALDAPYYDGGKYAVVAAAPDNTFLNMEYPNYAYSPAQLVYDVEDPRKPKLVSSWWVPGQRLTEDQAYRAWNRAGNRTSWTGCRMPMGVPTPLEEGGRYGYAPMGALGLWILDMADPGNPEPVGRVELPISLAGVEGDNVDVTRVDERGIVLVNGYPMNEDCYEAYKDVYVIDVSDPQTPEIVATLPRPSSPPGAPFDDFGQRRGKFGPKRPGYFFMPGKADPNLTVYSFANAGVQVFDISDERDPKIVAYFVPRLGGDLNKPGSYVTPTDAIHVEWDRKLIWAFTNSGIYLLSTPTLGEPSFDPPR
jgi:hypothetical protein